MASVMTFYRFVELTDLPGWRDTLEADASALSLCGTILLAEEGINATLAGATESLQRFRDRLRSRPGLAGLAVRFSAADTGNPVFYRLKVRIKPEIVRLDQPGVAPDRRTGEHVDARRWNALLDDPGVVVVDARNRYEIAIGTFPGAVDPGTRSFRQFPDFVRRRLDPARHRRVAMFCTGGVRCEKASAWMLDQGFEAVYQLDGGILNYLETVPPAENRWQGECFVFDQRVSVDAELGEGSFEQCHACRRPLSAEDLASDAYRPGECCPHCVDTLSDAQRAAFRERRRQVELAARRGQRHVGATPPRPTPASGGIAMHPNELDPRQRDAIEAAAFRRLLDHLDERKDVQNIDLMNLAGFCRNCLSKWYAAAAAEAGVEIGDKAARERVYGMPYADWKARYQREAGVEQLARFQGRSE
jgi:UPF0176 protein